MLLLTLLFQGMVELDDDDFVESVSEDLTLVLFANR